MKLLKKHKCLFGTSVCYTSKNYDSVTSDEFYDFMIENGAKFAWYFHYMPVGADADTELLLTPEQREHVYRTIRQNRNSKTGKPIFTVDFQNDGEFVGGCIAGGRNYFHVNSEGDVEPCVFIHYSDSNIREKSILECLKSPLFHEYYKGQPFNDNMLRPCPMLEIRKSSGSLLIRPALSQQIFSSLKAQRNFAQSATFMLKIGRQRLRKFGRSRSASTHSRSTTVTLLRAKRVCK